MQVIVLDDSGIFTGISTFLTYETSNLTNIMTA